MLEKKAHKEQVEDRIVGYIMLYVQSVLHKSQLYKLSGQVQQIEKYTFSYTGSVGSAIFLHCMIPGS